MPIDRNAFSQKQILFPFFVITNLPVFRTGQIAIDFFYSSQFVYRVIHRIGMTYDQNFSLN